MTLQNNSLVVAKFGGTSMANASAMKKSADIVRKNPQIKIVVVSATSGTTNQLVKICNLLEKDQKAKVFEELESLKLKHIGIAKDLNSKHEEMNQLNSLFQELAQAASGVELKKSKESIDHLISYGERLSAHLFVTALCGENVPAQFFDVREIMITDDHFGKAEPQLSEIFQRTEKYLQPLLRNDRVLITQGFVGATLSGKTTTLGRGGSDFSAALLAESTRADELQIWTDVPGIMTMDPNSIKEARIIPTLSFSEAAELANFGAKVLHPATIWPAVRQNIRTFVGSTFTPELGGTWIYPNSPTNTQLGACIKAVALRKSQTLITVTSLRMLNAHGFLAKLFGCLAQHRLSVDLVTTSEVSVALTIDQNSLGSSGERITENSKLIADLREFCDVTIEDGLTLVAIIGTGISYTPRLSARTFSAISHSNIRLICHGASQHNLCFLVKAEEALDVVSRLHHEFIGSQNEQTE